MKKETKTGTLCAIGLLLSFAIWTLLLRFVDVGAIGANGTSVGFATINKAVHELTGANMTLYNITDWLGLVPIFTVICFAILGLAQWIKRKSILKVDKSIIALGVFYVAVMAFYLLFEVFVLNYRPILIDGRLEASYPSSTTMLVLCVMPTAMMQLSKRIKDKPLCVCTLIIISAFSAFMVIGRILSGVHWISDIIGGSLLSAGLVTLYYTFGRFELK